MARYLRKFRPVWRALDAGPGTQIPSITSSPTIAGTARVNDLVTASSGATSATPTLIEWQWLREGSAIAGATSSTYSPQAADLGARLSVQQVIWVGPLASLPAVSAQTAAVVDVPVSDIIRPTIAGPISPSNVTANGGTISWQAGSDNVCVTRYRYSRDSGSTWTIVGNVLSANLVSLAASTTYDLRVQAGDAAGNWSDSISGTLTTLAPAADTRPRHFRAPANAATVGAQGYIDGATRLDPSANGGKAGTFTTSGPITDYGWYAALVSAGTPVFTDVASGLTGGWTRQADVVHSTGTYQTWRMDYPGASSNVSVA